MEPPRRPPDGGWVPTDRPAPGPVPLAVPSVTALIERPIPPEESLFRPRVQPGGAPGPGLPPGWADADRAAEARPREAKPAPEKPVGPPRAAGPARSSRVRRRSRWPAGVGRVIEILDRRGRPRLGQGPERRARLFLARRRRSLGIAAVLLASWLTIRSAAPSPAPTVLVSLAARDLPAGHRLSTDDLRPGPWPARAAPQGRLRAAAGQVLAAPVRAGEPLTDARVIGPGLLAGQAPGTVAVPVRLGAPAAGLLVRAGDHVDNLSSATAGWSSTAGLADGTSIDSSTYATADPTSYPTADPTAAATGPTEAITDSRAPGEGSGAGGAVRVAADALVLAAPGAAGDSSGSGAGSGTGSGSGGLGGPASGSSDATSSGVLVLAVNSAEAARLAQAQVSGALTVVMLSTG